jgi:hypothetical protein
VDASGELRRETVRFPTKLQYTPQPEDDGTWSIKDLKTGDMAIVSYGIVLRKLDHGICLDLVDTLNGFPPGPSERQVC